MNRCTAILCFALLCPYSKGQRNYFSLVTGFGPSYFFNDKSLNRPIDHSLLVGFNYVLNNKNRSFAFNPGIHLQTNKYHSRIQPGRVARINQYAINTHLDILMQVSKSTYLRAGIFFNLISHYNARIKDTQLNGNNYYAWSNDSLYSTYYGKDFQAGINVGVCFKFKFFRREQRLGLQLNHIASPLVRSDYTLSEGVAGKYTKVLSVNSRATMLLLTLEFALIKKEKKKKGEEEE